MLAQLTNLLDEFGQLPVHPEHLPTLMEIAGCAHKENECSNILAFFLDLGNPHGLGTLFLDAISQIGGIQNQGEAIDSNLSVEREVTTNKGNRIDILIQSDSHVVVIENKMSAAVNNPFRDYAKFAETLEPQDRHISKFLLTRIPTNAGCVHGFRNVTHRQLVDQIRALLGGYVGNADSRYLIFMLDFLNTLDNSQGGTFMNLEFIDFLAANFSEAKSFCGEIGKFKKELRKKIDTLASHIPDIDGPPKVKRFKWRESDGLRDVLVHEITLDASSVVKVDTAINPTGWKIEIFMWKSNHQDAKDKLERLLHTLEIPFETGPRFVRQRFEYATDLEQQIAPIVREVVRKLANSGDAWQADASS